jgi:hypothetical protein
MRLVWIGLSGSRPRNHRENGDSKPGGAQAKT